MNILKEIKYAYQRAYRGWSDRDCWDMSSYIAQINIEMLTELRDTAGGHPVYFKNMKAWQKELDIMIKGFEVHLKDDYKFDKNWEKRLHKRQAIQLKGLQSYAKYFDTLWD